MVVRRLLGVRQLSVVRRVLGVALAVVLALVPAAPAWAQGGTTPNPFQAPQLPQEQATIPQQQSQPLIINTTSTSSSSSGISGSSGIAIAIGALAVLGGISIFIWYDARRRAPARAAAGASSAPRVPGSKREKSRKLSPAERRRRKRGRAR